MPDIAVSATGRLSTRRRSLAALPSGQGCGMVGLDIVVRVVMQVHVCVRDTYMEVGVCGSGAGR